MLFQCSICGLHWLHISNLLTDDKGHKTSVLVLVKVWEDLNTNYQKLPKKLNILNGINEVGKAKKNGRKLQTLEDFLSDSNG